MQTLLIATLALVGYLIAYYTYGRWLSRRIFQLDPDRATPAETLCDGRDYVPTRREIVFGHHFTSIAGTGPIVGPALAVFWGWLPALIWVLLGSVFIGAVHDLGALVVSLRNRGQTVGEIAGRVLNARVRVLFLAVLFLVLMVVIGIFGLVLAVIFAAYPVSVLAIWVAMPIAAVTGVLMYKRGGNVLTLSMVALALLYAAVWTGAYYLPLNLADLGIPLTGKHALAAGQSPWLSAVVIWTGVLLVYCFIASVLPVWTLLQPRDFINSHQLISALALLGLGLAVTGLTGAPGGTVTSPAINWSPPADAPPIFPFLFVTIACGAVSGFHCLVSSGTSSKQLRRETDAQYVGYGAMLLEGMLAVLVILACTAGLSKGIWQYNSDALRYVPRVDAAGAPIAGQAAWEAYYGQNEWAGMTLAKKVGAFIEGSGNLLTAIGLPITFAIGLMAVLVASFAATTLDTATRLQRYVVTELGSACGIGALRNRYLATGVAVVTGGLMALIPGEFGPGSGGLILWPVFGAINQLLAGLAFLVIAFYLLRHRRPVWFLMGPLVFMLIVPAWAMVYNLAGHPGSWWAQGRYELLAIGVTVVAIQVWMVIEAALLWPKVRGLAIESATPPKPDAPPDAPPV